MWIVAAAAAAAQANESMNASASSEGGDFWEEKQNSVLSAQASGSAVFSLFSDDKKYTSKITATSHKESQHT